MRHFRITCSTAFVPLNTSFLLKSPLALRKDFFSFLQYERIYSISAERKPQKVRKKIMAVKTIGLTGTEVAVTELDGDNVFIRNDGTDTIYASKNAGITAGADGVASVPAGQSYKYPGICGTLYLLGNGQVHIQTSDFNDNPFKSAVTLGSVTEEISGAVCNLLDNANFRINQRGKSEYTGSGYTVDRWSINGGVLVAADDGIVITNNGTSTVRFRQNAELNYSDVKGSTVALSAKSNGMVYKQSGIIPQSCPTGNDVAIINLKVGDCSINFNYSPSTNTFYAYAAIPKDCSINISWIKLECGSIATPFFPPDPATELARCQRYYQIRSTGDIAAVDMRPTMRVTPTVTQLADGNYAYSAEL